MADDLPLNEIKTLKQRPFEGGAVRGEPVSRPDRRAKGSAMSVRQDANGLLTITLSDSCRRKLYRALKDQTVFAGDEPVVIARAMSRVGDAIGEFGIETLIRIGAGELGEGVTVFDGLPFEAVEWSPYPGMPTRSAKDTCLSELLLLGFGAYMGEPYGVSSEGETIINQLIPSIEDLERFTGNGSKRNLGLHKENAASTFLIPGLDFSPKALMLTGVSEQARGGPATPVAIAARAIAMLTDVDREVLRGLSVFIKAPERWCDGDQRLEIGPVPLIIGPDGREHIVAALYNELTRPAHDAASEALAKLEVALNAVSIPLRVIPGRLVHLANGPVLHGRSDFEPEISEDGRARRWLQRIFLSGRVEGLKGKRDPHERVFDLVATARASQRLHGA